MKKEEEEGEEEKNEFLCTALTDQMKFEWSIQQFLYFYAIENRSVIKTLEV